MGHIVSFPDRYSQLLDQELRIRVWDETRYHLAMQAVVPDSLSPCESLVSKNNAVLVCSQCQ